MKIVYAFILVSLLFLAACGVELGELESGDDLDILIDGPEEAEVDEQVVFTSSVEGVGAVDQKTWYVDGDQESTGGDFSYVFEEEGDYNVSLKVQVGEVEYEEITAIYIREITDDIDDGEIPDGCTEWFDGCNTCQVEDGEAVCTMMACDEYEEPECRSFDDERDEDDESDDENEERISEDGLKYRVQDGEAIVTGHSSRVSELEIPEELGGYTVVGIANSAFFDPGSEGTKMNSVDLPDTIEFIGARAFMYQELEGELVLPENLKEIGTRAFRGDEPYYDTGNQIDSLTIQGDNLEKIGSQAFHRNLNLSGGLNLPDNVRYIGELAFARNELSGELNLPNSLETIGSSAFSRNEFSGTLSLPDNADVDSNAFSSNDFTGVVIPGSYTTVPGAFRGNDISSVDIHEGVEVIEGGAFRGNPLSGSLDLPDGLIEIGERAFNTNMNYGFSGELDLPDSLESIGSNAFAHNSFSGELKLPDNLEEIGFRAFRGNDFDPSKPLVIPDNVERIADEGIQLTAYNFSAMQEDVDTFESIVKNPDTELGEEALPITDFAHTNTVITGPRYKENGENSTVYELVANHGHYLFKYKNMYELYDAEVENEEITIKGFKDNIERTGTRNTAAGAYPTFQNEDNIRIALFLEHGIGSYEDGNWTLEIPEKLGGEYGEYPVTKISEDAFDILDRFDYKLILPETIREIEEDAFTFGTLTSLTGAQGFEYLEKVGDGVFSQAFGSGYASHDVDLNFENAVHIGNGSFAGISAVDNACEELSLGDNLEYIGDYAFHSCTFEEEDIPENAEIGDGVINT